MTIQLIIVLIMIVLAAGFLGYRAWRSAALQRSKSGCGPGCGCGKV
ncbi:MAG: FeoB-associated Cys-rich membrane protein [Acidobacteriota bacterium]|nr:MAG: FeoB-associated Cys-rich membrane protein [Acidobacteriota bacterium]